MLGLGRKGFSYDYCVYVLKRSLQFDDDVDLTLNCSSTFIHVGEGELFSFFPRNSKLVWKRQRRKKKKKTSVQTATDVLNIEGPFMQNRIKCLVRFRNKCAPYVIKNVSNYSKSKKFKIKLRIHSLVKYDCTGVVGSSADLLPRLEGHRRSNA